MIAEKTSKNPVLTSAVKCLNLDSYDLPDEHDTQCPVHLVILQILF